MTGPSDVGTSAAQAADFTLLGPELGRDLESALITGVDAGALFASSAEPLGVYRTALAAAIADTGSDLRRDLFRRLLLDGPYEDSGGIPEHLRSERLSDQDAAAAITFVHSHMVNCFKGALAEMLAISPCLRLVQDLEVQGRLPDGARLHIGDRVSVRRAEGAGRSKGADMHVLIEKGAVGENPTVTVAGVVEVKSCFRPEVALRRQLAAHLRRAAEGLEIGGVVYTRDRVHVGLGEDRRVVRIRVLPDLWKLPRTIRWEETHDGRGIVADGPVPPLRDQTKQLAETDWQITLKWSEEAIASAAHDVTFWYMGKVGESAFTECMPAGWEEMTPAGAGQNAVKMMLYYAIRRFDGYEDVRWARAARQRAVALYNSYGFGYAIGMNYRDARRRRQMLWPQDLDEIVATGRTGEGCRITG